MRIFILILMFCSQLAASAENASLYSNSVSWDNVAARTMLLGAAAVPHWDERTINLIYDIYTHPEQHQLPSINNTQKYNTIFLDAYWGPAINPFVKYQRPAKIFAYAGTPNKSYMAVLVKSDADDNFYVYNRVKSKPQLLDEWISEIKAKENPQFSLKFNVCSGYGNLPNDTCMGRSYQDEENYALSNGNTQSTVLSELHNPPPSSYRSPSEDWHHYAANNVVLHAAGESGSIFNSSVAWGDQTERAKLLLTTTAWPNYKVINDNFKKIRDVRYFNDDQKNNFLRRISWLYPDDGCWTRASAVINHFFGAARNAVNQFPRPSKVFAFGNLCANTANSPNGHVNWWYHTAPLVRDEGTNQVYVLDPSIDSEKPMTIETWMTTVSSNTGACHNNIQKSHVDKFNVCTGYGAGPGDICSSAKVNFDSEAAEALRQNYFLANERDRQVELNRDPDKVLGDLPPWY